VPYRCAIGAKEQNVLVDTNINLCDSLWYKTTNRQIKNYQVRLFKTVFVKMKNIAINAMK
jgi:hypothetical protein